MKQVHYAKVPAEAVTSTGAAKTTIRWLIAEKDGAQNFCMRLFEIAPGGMTPEHDHAWEHEIFILEGQGTFLSDEGDKAFAAGDAIFMPGGERHQFRNTSDEMVKMLCLIPART